MMPYYADIVNRHVMRTGIFRKEEYCPRVNTQDGVFCKIIVSVGDMCAEAIAIEGTPKKELLGLALKAFVEKYGAPSPKPAPNLQNYLDTSRKVVMVGATIHYNNTEIFKTKPDVVAFDSEGQNPPTIVQLCACPTDVYILEYDKHSEMIKELLVDSSVKKIVCDLKAETMQLGHICNAVDIQGHDKKSLVKIINEFFGIPMYKDKKIHYSGWKLPLSKNQIEYAAADALWTYLCYNFLSKNQ